MRKFDDFNDRHGKDNAKHNDNYYFNEETIGKKHCDDVENCNKDTRIKHDKRYVIIDTDGKVLSNINDEINYFDTIDMEDGGYKVAVKFEDKTSAEDFMKDELDKKPDLEIEVLPVKEAFAFLEDEESSKYKKTEISADKVYKWELKTGKDVGYDTGNNPTAVLDFGIAILTLSYAPYKDSRNEEYFAELDFEGGFYKVAESPSWRTAVQYVIRKYIDMDTIPDVPEDILEALYQEAL